MLVPLPVGSLLGYISFCIALVVMYWYWRDRRLLRAKMAEYGPPLRAMLEAARDPKYLAEVLAQVICYGKVDSEGKPITAPADVLYGMFGALTPAVLEWAKANMPELMRAYFQAQKAAPDDPSALGRALVAHRGGKWARAAQAGSVVAKKSGMGGIAEIIGMLPDLAEGLKAMKELAGQVSGQSKSTQPAGTQNKPMGGAPW